MAFVAIATAARDALPDWLRTVYSVLSDGVDLNRQPPVWTDGTTEYAVYSDPRISARDIALGARALAAPHLMPHPGEGEDAMTREAIRAAVVEAVGHLVVLPEPEDGEDPFRAVLAANDAPPAFQVFASEPVGWGPVSI